MKYLFILFICSFSFISSSFSQKSVNNIIKQIKNTEHYEGIKIPGWALYLGLKIAESSDDELKDMDLMRIAKHIKSVRVATTKLDESKFNVTAIVNNFIKSVKDKDQFDEYISVRSEDQNLKIMIQEKKDVIKNIVILSAEGSDLACIHLKTDFQLDDLKNISFADIKKNIPSK